MSAIDDLSDLTVLIVDDEATVTRLAKTMLTDLDVAQVFVANDGREALDFLGLFEDDIDVIVCDWNMPRMSGLELLQQIRTVDPNMPFVMLTGRNDMDSIVAARDLKVSSYLLKPFSQEQLAQHLVNAKKASILQTI
jgi:two-component system chemotaxis response regulator CheY